MKKAAVILLVMLVMAGAWLVAQNAAARKPLSQITPAGAVLYLEAKNFSSLLTDWNASTEKKTWLDSDNFQVFSRSQLYLKLAQVFGEYADGVGVAPDMTLLSSIAGGESALAFYDINKIEFLYVTRLPSARAMQSVLWKAKEKFTARNAANTNYYVKTESAKRRTAAFAISGDLLLISTKEDALVSALALLNNAAAASVSGETWFKDAAASATGSGDLRLITNMERLTRTPAFRSYWVQNNVGDLQQYTAGIDDLTRSAREVKEERVLLRADATTPPETAAVPALMRLAGNAALYRAWAQPDSAAVADLVVRKVLRQGPRSFSATKAAPNAASEGGDIAGDTNDFETRIDGAPFEAPGPIFRPERLTRAFTSNRAAAMLHLESPGTTPDKIFVTTSAVIALEGAADWNAGELRDALSEALEGLYTTGKIGVNWKQRPNDTGWEMDGLARIAILARGRTLLLASTPEALDSVLPLWNAAPAASAASYAAGYRFASQLNSYDRLMGMIEFPQPDRSGPSFFSTNLGSLARTLQRVQNVSIAVRDDGRNLRQTVIYRLP